MELQNKTELYSVEFEQLASKYGLEKLCKSIKNTLTLTTLNIFGNNIGDEGCKYLLKDNTTLTTLNISFNNIGNEGCKYLLKDNTTLTSFLI